MGTAAMAAQTRRRRDELVWRVGQAADASAVFASASPRLRRLVAFDAAAWVATDPSTGLPSGPVRAEDVGGLTAELCSQHWLREYTVDDVNLFSDLVRAAVPAAGLRATMGDPSASGRYRTLLRPLGFGDELRATLRVGATPWGVITLWRRAGRPAFSQQDVKVMAGLSEPLGHALRIQVRREALASASGDGSQPGLLLFDPAANLVSANEAARSWLRELPAEKRFPTDLGAELPLWMIAAVHHAVAAAHRLGSGSTRVRVRSRRGAWLVGHATGLRRADGSLGEVAVVLEPATQADIAPIVVEAYDLTAREQQITRLVAGGAGTAEIANRLFLSRHTVRDHVKAVLQKVGVSSRGELVAKLYAEHYRPTNPNDVVRVEGAGTA
jgi:DNA-binding CsgD family transcriptional regulator